MITTTSVYARVCVCVSQLAVYTDLSAAVLVEHNARKVLVNKRTSERFSLSLGSQVRSCVFALKLKCKCIHLPALVRPPARLS